MEIVFCKSKWEMWDDPLDVFIQRVCDCGFSATEIYLPPLKESPEEVAALHREHELDLVAQIFTEGATPADHVRSLEEQLEIALRCNSVCANCHAGRDIFTFEENVGILQRLIDLSDETGVPLLVETHRRRPTYSAPETRRYLVL
jgi:sugar phosphate isomerase/epimerase